MRVLAACEMAGKVRDAFRRRGHQAWSCDILPDFFGNDTYHLQMDVFKAIREYEWDLMIAFPPCTHLSCAGSMHWPAKAADGRQEAAARFFKRLWRADIPYIAIENPIGYMNTNWRKPDQIFNPWNFGEGYRKKTCLWLKNLQPLVPEVAEYPGDLPPVVSSMNKSRPGYVSRGVYEDSMGRKNRATMRSMTFPGVARAMAEQWGKKSGRLPLDMP